MRNLPGCDRERIGWDEYLVLAYSMGGVDRRVLSESGPAGLGDAVESPAVEIA